MLLGIEFQGSEPRAGNGIRWSLRLPCVRNEGASSGGENGKGISRAQSLDKVFMQTRQDLRMQHLVSIQGLLGHLLAKSREPSSRA